MNKEKIKILFIGLGGIGQRHLCNVHAKFGDDAILSAYRIRNLKLSISPNLEIDDNIDLIKEYSVDVFTDLDNALEKSPDIVFICNPTSCHIDSCITVANAGCDFFVEKPLSNSLNNIKELLSICQSKKLIGFVGFQLRFHPCYKLLKKLISENVIGDLLSVHAEIGEYLPGWHKYEDYRHIYASRKDLGGGVVLSQIHEIVVALGGHLSHLDIDVEDIADILLDMRYKEKRLPATLHMDYIQRPPSRYCKIIGELGNITMDLIRSRPTIERIDKEPEIHNFNLERNELFVDEIDHFFKCIYSRQQPIVTIGDGVNSLKIALAIKESIDTGKVVEIDENHCL